jgi:hypothetical protein
MLRQVGAQPRAGRGDSRMSAMLTARLGRLPTAVASVRAARVGGDKAAPDLLGQRRVRQSTRARVVMQKVLVALVVGVSMTFTAIAQAVSNGSFRGHTSQHLQITLTVKGNKIVKTTYKAKYRCSNGETTVQPTAFGAPDVAIPLPHGRWGGTITLSHGTDVAHFSGEFTGNQVKGKLQESYVSTNGLTCVTRQLTFTAKR